MAQLTKHFQSSEFACRCCGGLPAAATLQKTAEFLEQVREKLGGRSITINSGYRCPKHNAKVGGAKNSQHKLGTAADITVSGLSPAQVQEVLAPLEWVGGLGRYENFTHCDRRPVPRGEKPARWNG